MRKIIAASVITAALAAALAAGTAHASPPAPSGHAVTGITVLERPDGYWSFNGGRELAR